MILPRAFDEIVDFIAAGSQPVDVVAFRPSETTRARVAELLEREKATGLDAADRRELDQFEHVMRLAKARARQHLGHE